MVQASAEQAERGLDILHGQHTGGARPISPNGSTWPCGVVSHGDTTRHTAPGTLDTPGLARSETVFRQHQEARRRRERPIHGVRARLPLWL